MDGLVLGDVDDLAPARPLDVDVRRQRRPEGEQGGDVVGGEGGRPDRRVGIGKPGLVHEAAEGLADHVVGGPAQVVGMPALPVPRHVRDHEAGVGGQHDVVGEAPLGERAGFRALHPDVAGADKAQEQLGALRGAQVEGDVEGVAPLLDEGAGHGRARLALDEGRETPPGVAGAARMLDLDDFGAEGPRQMGGVRLGDEGPGGEDPHALQRPERFRNETAVGTHLRCLPHCASDTRPRRYGRRPQAAMLQASVKRNDGSANASVNPAGSASPQKPLVLRTAVCASNEQARKRADGLPP